MDEHVIVRFDEDDRVVLVDGRPGGLTNRRMLTEKGTYTFSLEGVADFAPSSQKIVVENTTEEKPLIVLFERIGAPGRRGGGAHV